MIGVGYKRKLREWVEKWRLVASALEGKKGDAYAQAVKDVVRDLERNFHLIPKAKPTRWRRGK
jgi:hypothetical protein